MKFCITVLMAISMVGNAALIRLPLDFEVNNLNIPSFNIPLDIKIQFISCHFD